MNKQKTLILGIIVLIAIFMGIGYAAISNIELKITGTANATANQENFNVYFTGANTIKSGNDVDVTVTSNAKEAIVNFSGLTTKGDTKYAILEIENGSNDIVAGTVTVTATSSNENVFKATAIMCNESESEIENTELAVGEKTYVKVSVELLKTVIDDDSSEITAKIIATPKAN